MSVWKTRPFGEIAPYVVARAFKVTSLQATDAAASGRV